MFDVAVLPADFTHLPSGISPQKLYSYLACGKPVLASSIPGLIEFFSINNVGSLFESGNSTALAEKILEFQNIPQEKICKFSRNARKCVEENYAWEKIVSVTITFTNNINKENVYENN